MKLTRASHYALIALTHMAQQPDIKVAIASDEIAYQRNLPERFLLKVLQPLVDKKLLRSCKGPNGGYVLNKTPSEISMLDIIEAADHTTLEGSIPPPYQPNQKSEKEKKEKKEKKKERPPNPGAEKTNIPVNNKLLTICQQNSEMVREHLRKIKLSDLAKKK
jgi:Rrf2 family protein